MAQSSWYKINRNLAGVPEHLQGEYFDSKRQEVLTIEDFDLSTEPVGRFGRERVLTLPVAGPEVLKLWDLPGRW